jgi:hypothetical protein
VRGEPRLDSTRTPGRNTLVYVSVMDAAPGEQRTDELLRSTGDAEDQANAMSGCSTPWQRGAER